MTLTTSNRGLQAINYNQVEQVKAFCNPCKGTLSANGRLARESYMPLAVLCRAMSWKKSVLHK